MRPTTRTPIIAIILLCAAGACAPAAGTGDFAPTPSEAAGWVEITNDGHQDVVLYMVRDGMRYRLGPVARMQTARFRVPRADGRRASYSVTLIADPSGGGSIFGTEPIRWRPGQTMLARVGRRAFSQSFDVVLR